LTAAHPAPYFTHGLVMVRGEALLAGFDQHLHPAEAGTNDGHVIVLH
jgi:hypothetical protein